MTKKQQRRKQVVTSSSSSSILIDDDWDNAKDTTVSIFNGKDIANIVLADEYDAIAFLFKKGGRVIEYDGDPTGRAMSREWADDTGKLMKKYRTLIEYVTMRNKIVSNMHALNDIEFRIHTEENHWRGEDIDPENNDYYGSVEALK